MLQENLDCQEGLEDLLQELDGISGDLSKYVNFLVSRENLIQKVFMDGPSSNN